MDNNTMLGKIVILLCGMTEGLGMIFDLLEKVNSTDGKNWRENLAKFLRKEPCWISSNMIQINRNRFNLKKLIGYGWSILNDETDARSIALTELDLTKVELRTMLQDGETYIKGEERLERLKKDGLIRLDADIFLMLWENQHLIPESWKEPMNGKTRYIFFYGTVIRRSGGPRCVLYLFWNGVKWRWDVAWLDSNWNDNDLSAVLVPLQ